MTEKQIQMNLLGIPQDEETTILPTVKAHVIEGFIGKTRTYERVENDFYVTDPIAAEWLCQIEGLNHDIWECACGTGNLSEVFAAHGYNVRSTDLIDRGYGQGGVNFFLQTEPWGGDIVTNPPYKYAKEFIEHALELVQTGNKVCMFLKLQYLEGASRRKLYDKNPPIRVWVSSKRIGCARPDYDVTAHSMMPFAWYVWEKGYKGETTLKWFN